MTQQITISEARANLSQLLKKIQKSPDAVFQITINGVVVGELRSPQAEDQWIQPGKAFSKALKKMGKPDKKSNGKTSRNHDDVLYGKS